MHSKVSNLDHCQKFPYWQERPLNVQIIPIPPWIYLGRIWPPPGVDSDVINIIAKYSGIRFHFMRTIERNIYRMVNLVLLLIKQHIIKLYFEDIGWRE